MAKQTKRVFEGSRKGEPFFVETTITDDEALAALDKVTGDFAWDCAIEIQKMQRGRPFRSNLVAWGFRLATEKPREVLALPASLLKRVKFRQPLQDEVAGYPIKMAAHGSRSKYEGQYTITDGGPFGDNKFYGRADKSGQWKPTQSTPQEIIDYLMSK